ncbi:MAG TPA: 50S ribosomal protein L11 methyltransferase [Gammaproteobacteria bacterium]|nr:50S ribosomal protein L11 methyltransferase [Gammaproteobacteria bacterium]
MSAGRSGPGAEPDWIEARLAAARDQVDAVEEALAAAGAAVVTVAGADGEPNFAPGRVWGQNLVSALFAAGDVPADLEERLAAALGFRVALEWVPVEGLDWAHAWKAHFHAFPVGERLWVRPSWVTAEPPAGRAEVVLDPGMAFGTGQHGTTRLCLEWLDANVDSGAAPELLDYGCGSGILAIAAAKLGASRVLAVDNESQALEATRANAEANGVGDRIEVAHADGRVAARGAFPLVIANILSQTLMALAEDITATVAPGGRLALSGILLEHAERVSAAFPGITWTGRADDGEWVRLDGVREGG